MRIINYPKLVLALGVFLLIFTSILPMATRELYLLVLAVFIAMFWDSSFKSNWKLLVTSFFLISAVGFLKVNFLYTVIFIELALFSILTVEFIRSSFLIFIPPLGILLLSISSGGEVATISAQYVYATFFIIRIAHLFLNFNDKDKPLLGGYFLVLLLSLNEFLATRIQPEMPLMLVLPIVWLFTFNSANRFQMRFFISIVLTTIFFKIDIHFAGLVLMGLFLLDSKKHNLKISGNFSVLIFVMIVIFINTFLMGMEPDKIYYLFSLIILPWVDTNIYPPIATRSKGVEMWRPLFFLAIMVALCF